MSSTLETVYESQAVICLDLTYAEVVDVLSGLDFLKWNTADKNFEDALQKLTEKIRAAL